MASRCRPPPFPDPQPGRGWSQWTLSASHSWLFPIPDGPARGEVMVGCPAFIGTRWAFRWNLHQSPSDGKLKPSPSSRRRRFQRQLRPTKAIRRLKAMPDRITVSRHHAVVVKGGPVAPGMSNQTAQPKSRLRADFAAAFMVRRRRGRASGRIADIAGQRSRDHPWPAES